MPFARTGEISQNPLEGGIEISSAQYDYALSAMLQGSSVVVQGSELEFSPFIDTPLQVDGPYRVFKSTVIRRMTDVEAEVVDGIISETTAKMRLIYNSSEYFVSNDPLFAMMRDMLAGSIAGGLTRANELLGPEDAAAS